MRNFIAILLILLCGKLNAGTIDINTPDSQHINYGSKHECIVEIGGEYEKNTKFRASAVVFRPQWILTAAHIIKEAKNCHIRYNGEEIPILCIAHPDAYNEDKFGENDIAVGKLSKPVSLDFYPQLYTKDDEVGKTCSISGFGLTGPYQISATRKSDGRKRAGTNTINRTENQLLICNLTDTKTSLEFLICHGDSGGGLFIDQKIAGINSCIFSDDKILNSDINDESGHTRISLFVDWIEKSIQKIEQDNKCK